MRIEAETHANFAADNDSVGTSAKKIADNNMTLYKGVTIRAAPGNTDNIYVNSVAEVSATNGFLLDGGDEITIPVDRLDKVWIIGGAAAQAYSWLAI